MKGKIESLGYYSMPFLNMNKMYDKLSVKLDLIILHNFISMIITNL